MRAPSIRDHVTFTRPNGDPVVAIVEVVWGRQISDDRPPLLNVREVKSGDVHTSVPHKSDVTGATGFFYS